MFLFRLKNNRFWAQRSAILPTMEKLNFNRLGYDNYEVWKVRARQFLTREGLWSFVNDDPPALKSRSTEWSVKDELALQTIGYLVEDPQLRIFQDATTANEAWKMLKEHYVKESSVSKVALIKRLSKLELMEGGDMRKHLSEMEDLFERLENVGCQVTEDVKGAFMLASLPSSYDNTVSAIQGRMEVFRIGFVKTKLLEEYGRQRDKDSVQDEKAMMTRRETWMPRDEMDTRVCFACGSPNHIMRFCDVLQRAKKEAKEEELKKKRQQQAAKTAVDEDRRDVCFATMEKTPRQGWFLDSGASRHMTGSATQLDDSKQNGEQEVVLANGEVLVSKRSGSKRIHARDGNGGAIGVTLKDVIVVDGLTVNLISVQAIVMEGFDVSFNGRSCSISKNDVTLVKGVKDGQYYRLDY